jgi:hypothetical protein
MGKPFWKSKTLAFNSFMALLTLLIELGPIFDQLAEAGIQHPVLETDRMWISVATLIGNVILRTVTSEPVRLH